ncbi:MAG: folylpolyglutamate synthase/dihydrofolate synthase family protein [Patescibacteria group bacterium]
MFSSIIQAQKFLQDLDQNRDDHYTTERIKEFLDYLDNPQNKFKSIHVAGTSGKGSTCVMIAKILEEAGYKTGLTTSPYLISPLEKIIINSRQISETNFIKLLNQYKKLLIKFKLTYFESYIALTFIYFADKKIDWAVVETGLGGRFDATNVLNSNIAIITTIDLDHTDLLGKTRKQIAREKQAIIKPGSIAITGSKLIKNAKYINLNNTKKVDKIKLGLKGEFQKKNALLALTASKILKIPNKHIINGLKKAKHEGRFEIISKKPFIIMDGAHSPEKMKAFTDSLKLLVLNKNKFNKKYLLLSIKEDKDYKKIINYITPLVDEITLTSFSKSYKLDILKKYINQKFPHKTLIKIKDSKKAYTKIEQQLNNNDLLIITGSLYMIGDLKK